MMIDKKSHKNTMKHYEDEGRKSATDTIRIVCWMLSKSFIEKVGVVVGRLLLPVTVLCYQLLNKPFILYIVKPRIEDFPNKLEIFQHRPIQCQVLPTMDTTIDLQMCRSYAKTFFGRDEYRFSFDFLNMSSLT